MLKRLVSGLVLAAVTVSAPPVSGDAAAMQRIVVEVASPGATSGTLRLVETVNGAERTLVGPVAARVGRNGVKRARREGDGTTPLGEMRIVGAFGSAASPRVSVSYRRVRRGDCWISDVGDAAYNTLVSRTTCMAPNENMYRIAAGGTYEYALTTSYNTSPIVPGKGSAIFIHVHSRDGAGRSRPTSGCVSVARLVMKRLFALLDPAKNPTLVVRIKR